MTIETTTSGKIDQISEMVGPIRLPLEVGSNVVYFELIYFKIGNERWASASLGEISSGEAVLTRIESACLFGHIFGSRQCDCGFQLDEAFRQIAIEGRGLILYAIDQDARGLGIKRHFQIYVMRQQEGLDTPEIYEQFNAPKDGREYTAVAAILEKLNVCSVELMTNNPGRLKSLANLGIDVTQRELEAVLDDYNMATLMLEKEDLGYNFSFKTHSHWLQDVQLAVGNDPDMRAVIAVHNNEVVVARWVGKNWNVAENFVASIGSDVGAFVVYVSDLPRVDELAQYAEVGANIIVAPFPSFPESLTAEANRIGIKLQDWGRENRYTEPREQWILISRDRNIDYYKRGSESRELRR